MTKNFIQTPPAERLVARLYTEGWVDCVGLGFPALSQLPLGNLQTFILSQLQAAGGELWQTDLQLQALIFSIPAHEFQFHPHLRQALKQLEDQGVILIVDRPQPQRQSGKTKMAPLISLVSSRLPSSDSSNSACSQGLHHLSPQYSLNSLRI